MTNDKLKIKNECVPSAYYIIYIHLTFVIFNLTLLLFTLVNPVYAQTTFDPLAIGVGARALGMGKAYVAVAEDGDTIFTNPAGLGEIDAFQFTSMSGQILGDINYTLLGGVYPLGEKASIGLGYAGAAVSGIEIRDTMGNLDKRAEFINSVFFVSYGKKITDKLSLGINFKRYFQEGTEIDEGDGAGINLDIGFLQKGLGYFSLGVVCQNVISSWRMIYKNKEQEEMPQVIKVGTRLHLLGEEFESAILSPIHLTAALDADLSLKGSKPSTTHLGVEFSPLQGLTLRAGWDQDPKPGGVQSTLTSGVSLKIAGIGFHYAYHPYGETETATHYFSLSFDEQGWPFEGPPDIFLGSSKNGLTNI